MLRSAKGAIAKIIKYLQGTKKPVTKSRSKVKQMAKKPTQKKKFRKSDLGFYEDEEGYAALLKAYQEKEGKK